MHAASTADQLRGHWEAEVAGEGKKFMIYFNLDAKRDTLTGTVELAGSDRQFEIQHGRVMGNNISFVAIGTWTGTLEGTELKLTRELDGGKKQHMIAHRSATP
jgi:hypothetical protein